MLAVSKRPNPKVEAYFLKLVDRGILTVTKSGIVTNNKTGSIAGRSKNNSYLYITYKLPSGRKIRMRIHRLVWMCYKGPIPEHLLPNHKNGIKHDNRLSNLEIVTTQRNLQHAYDIGLNVAINGEDHYAAVLTDNQVVKIRSLFRKRITIKELATKYSVCESTIKSCLYSGWKHVPDILSKSEYDKITKNTAKTCLAGEKNHNAILTVSDIPIIRRLHARGGYGNTKKLADSFGVSVVTIRNVAKRKIWSHVP